MAPDKPASALVQADAGVLAVLSCTYTDRQVPIENVQRNPFIIYGESPVALTSMDDGGAWRDVVTVEAGTVRDAVVSP